MRSAVHYSEPCLPALRVLHQVWIWSRCHAHKCVLAVCEWICAELGVYVNCVIVMWLRS